MNVGILLDNPVRCKAIAATPLIRDAAEASFSDEPFVICAGAVHRTGMQPLLSVL
jgi:hypothetical protein